MWHTFTVVTWNIAGARRIAGANAIFDYSGEDIVYFVDQLRRVSPDIICLQETHSNAKRVIAKEIAEALGLAYVYDAPVSSSHIDADYRLGNAIISRRPLKHVRDVTYPFPEYAMRFADGRPAQRHDKMMQIYELEGLQIINTQLLPLHIFGKDYRKNEGAELAAQIERLWRDNVHPPFIFCGDFNLPDRHGKIFPQFHMKFAYGEPLPPGPTRPDIPGILRETDCILTSTDILFGNSGILLVEADHYVCFAQLKVDTRYAHQRMNAKQ
jgi:endonuclease/exonuclease/phosphatase family metal-dependent hydrolase